MKNKNAFTKKEKLTIAAISGVFIGISTLLGFIISKNKKKNTFYPLHCYPDCPCEYCEECCMECPDNEV